MASFKNGNAKRHRQAEVFKDLPVPTLVKTLTEYALNCAVGTLESALPSPSPTAAIRTPALTNTFCEPATLPNTPALSAPLSSPTSLSVDDFVAKAFLGKGAFGEVYRVEHKVSHKEYALKVISKENLRLSNYPTIFEEQRIMKLLSGTDHTINLIASFQDTDYFYILTDYLSGGDLKHRLYNRHKFPPIEHTREYMAQLILAVEGIHRQRVIHRDLKPENIFSDSEGRLVIGDFGISAYFGAAASDKPWEAHKAWQKDPNASRTSPPPPSPAARLRSIPKKVDYTVSRCGTSSYMAPEVTSGPYSYECDIWSLGVIFHTMAVGRYPFGMHPGQHDHNEMRRLVNSENLRFTVDDDIDPDTEELLHGMLEKDVADRMTIAEIKKHPFFDGVNWSDLAKGNLTYGPRKPLVTLDDGDNEELESIKIPAGQPYAPGTVPYPWFDYTSPEMLIGMVAAKSKVTFGGLSKKLNVLQKVKIWWRRRGVVKVRRLSNLDMLMA
ncbi:hypothetical protein NLI96_g4384 [Meripilus lineatus]|uniref:non-specific serine/threonine protein kinase n=1 Tax=Meripilus lineatus TaxID=2056292 RepID=A0AAD5V5C1_9APHY|nr:hypothetical protein NLI96_g4384 [Physisporinus lineatus]